MPSYVRGDSNFDTASAEKLTLMTAQATTSGTYVDFIGIPSWAKRVTVMFNRVSTSGSSNIIIQLGGTTFLTTGYLGSSALYPTQGGSLQTNGLSVDAQGASNAIRHGICTIVAIGNNTWVNSSNIGYSHAGVQSQGGSSVTLPYTLDRIRITTVNGTDTFDAGVINVMYEG